jgi:acyl carrier protein
MPEPVTGPSTSAEERITAFLVREFELPRESIHAGATLVEDLGLDSLDLVDMVVELESAVGHRIAPEKLKALRTVGDAVALVNGERGGG